MPPLDTSRDGRPEERDGKAHRARRRSAFRISGCRHRAREAPMRYALSSTIAAALLSIAAMQASPALAQRVFVAAQGSDGNPCSFALPCRTFQHAHDAVAAGGEIDVLDPAGYGALTITKSISIQGHGFAGISVPRNGAGIDIVAGASDVVHLNGLLIDGGAGAGVIGIRVLTGKSLVIENVVERGAQNGLSYNSTAATPQTLAVSDSTFADNASYGITVKTVGSAAITATLDRVGLYGNGVNGLWVIGNDGFGALNVAVTDSTAAGNGYTGFSAMSAPGGSVITLALARCTSSGNLNGVAVDGSIATMRLAQSTVTGNNVGYSVSGGAIASYGDNRIDSNGSNSGSLGAVARR
jgi:hypothetical protein